MTLHLAPAISTLFTVPYLTVDEFKRAPTGVDIKGLSGSPAPQRDAELANVIARASGLVNIFCKQNLAATRDVEQGRVRMDRNGEIHVTTFCWPILEVIELALGATPSQVTAVDLTELFIEHASFTVAQPSLALSTNQGPLQFGAIVPTTRAFAKWTYVNGWPTTTLTAIESAGELEIDVADVTGIHVGTSLTIYDADKQETVTVTGEPTGNVVPVTALANAHATVGVSVSALPPAIKEAAILMTCGLIKLRGNEALVMRTINESKPGTTDKNEPGIPDIRNAKVILDPFRATR